MSENRLYVTPNDPAGIPIYTNEGQQIDTAFIGDSLLCIEEPTKAFNRIGVSGEVLKIRKADGVEGYIDAGRVQNASIGQPVEAPTQIVWGKGHALAGIHGPADPGWGAWDDNSYQMIQSAHIDAVKLLASHHLMEGDPNKPAQIVGRLNQAEVKFIMARLFFQFGNKHPEQEFVNEVLPCARQLYDVGVNYFEVHNEPNISTPDSPEGMWLQWQNGKEFGDYYLNVVAALKEKLPNARFGFPGVSPGPDYAEQSRKIRYDSERFLSEADVAVQASDFVGMHVYWGGNGTDYSSALDTVQKFCYRYPRKIVMVTEFCNDHPDTNRVSKRLRGEQYASFYAGAKKLPTNLGAMYCYLLSSSTGYQMSTWDGDVVAAVSSRMVV